MRSTLALVAGYGPVVTLRSGEPVTATLNGFTLTHQQPGGQITGGDGVGMYASSATLTNNAITGIGSCAISALPDSSFATPTTLVINDNFIHDNPTGLSGHQCGPTQEPTDAGSTVTVYASHTTMNGNVYSGDLAPGSLVPGMELGEPNEYLQSTDFENNIILNSQGGTEFCAARAGGASLNGTVLFSDQSGTLTSVTVTNGQAAFSTAALAVGTRNVVATFHSNSANIASAASATLAEVVQPVRFHDGRVLDHADDSEWRVSNSH